MFFISWNILIFIWISLANIEDRSDYISEEHRALTPNQKLVQQARKLFETEKTIEKDAKKIMNKTKTLTLEDLKLISKLISKFLIYDLLSVYSIKNQIF